MQAGFLSLLHPLFLWHGDSDPLGTLVECQGVGPQLAHAQQPSFFRWPIASEKVIADYSDVTHYDGRLELSKKATGELYVMRNLQIGMTVPEIEAEDVDGVAFKLSDYRGKVILLDFWGDW